jgi:hypothetical protein
MIAPDITGTPFNTNYWVAEDGFLYWTDATDKFGRDIQFCDGGLLLWNWAPLNVVPQNPSIFQLPNGNCNTPCNPDGMFVGL